MRRIAGARSIKNAVGRDLAWGHGMQQMLHEKFMDARGIERAERHVLLVSISVLAVTICRLQHGISDGLSNIKCYN